MTSNLDIRLLLTCCMHISSIALAAQYLPLARLELDIGLVAALAHRRICISACDVDKVTRPAVQQALSVCGPVSCFTQYRSGLSSLLYFHSHYPRLFERENHGQRCRCPTPSRASSHHPRAPDTYCPGPMGSGCVGGGHEPHTGTAIR
jgi:hypothetical protein